MNTVLTPYINATAFVANYSYLIALVCLVVVAASKRFVEFMELFSVKSNGELYWALLVLELALWALYYTFALPIAGLAAIVLAMLVGGFALLVLLVLLCIKQ